MKHVPEDSKDVLPGRKGVNIAPNQFTQSYQFSLGVAYAIEQDTGKRALFPTIKLTVSNEGFLDDLEVVYSFVSAEDLDKAIQGLQTMRDEVYGNKYGMGGTKFGDQRHVNFTNQEKP